MVREIIYAVRLEVDFEQEELLEQREGGGCPRTHSDLP
jgi:hypothetical protein